jgi:hypothetical protein
VVRAPVPVERTNRVIQKVCVKRPERSLGSNQVLFGGMIWPASAMSISWPIVTGYSENATPPSALTR